MSVLCCLAAKSCKHWFHLTFLPFLRQIVAVVQLICRVGLQPQTIPIIIMRKLFVYMIYVFTLKVCETLPPDLMTGKFIRLIHTTIVVSKKRTKRETLFLQPLQIAM